MNLYSIYMYTSPTGKRYIGLTKDLASRHKQHANHKQSKCRRFASAVACCGINAFTRTIMETDLTLAQANERECYWISLLNTVHPNGYNLTAGGAVGVFSEETKGLMAGAAASRWNDAAYRDKNASRSKALWDDEQYRSKCANNNRERWQDPEFREKMSSIQSAAKNTPEYKAAISEKIKALWTDPDYRARMTARRKEQGVARALPKPQPMTTEERAMAHAKATSDGIKRKWGDPDYRAKHEATRSTPEHKKKMSNAQRKRRAEEAAGRKLAESVSS